VFHVVETKEHLICIEVKKIESWESRNQGIASYWHIDKQRPKEQMTSINKGKNVFKCLVNLIEKLEAMPPYRIHLLVHIITKPYLTRDVWTIQRQKQQQHGLYPKILRFGYMNPFLQFNLF